MRPVPAVAHRQCGVFTAEQALSAGWTRHALAHAVERGDLERLRPGVFAPPLETGGERYALAASRLRRAGVAVGLTHRRMTLSHSASAALDGLPLLHTPSTPCVTFARPFRGGVRGAHLHRARLFPGHVMRRHNVLLTSAGRTVVDLGREIGADQCVAAADAALRSGSTTTGLIDEVLERCCGWPHFYWDEYGVVGECDGLAKYDGPAMSLRDEKRRQGRMEDAGLIFVRWGWSELAAFEPVIAELRAAFARGTRPDRAPRLWTATPSWHPVRTAS